MTEYMSKDTLLQKMQDSYSSFSAFLATLDHDQFTTPGVNGNWSIKDNLAHISAWQKRVLDFVQAVRDNRTPPNPTPGMSIDEINEHIYQANRTRSVEDVLSELNTISQQLIAGTQELSEEQLNRPVAGRDDKPIWRGILGDTAEHYEEHGQIIKNWFATQNAS
jgi:hypothetical protein